MDPKRVSGPLRTALPLAPPRPSVFKYIGSSWLLTIVQVVVMMQLTPFMLGVFNAEAAATGNPDAVYGGQHPGTGSPSQCAHRLPHGRGPAWRRICGPAPLRGARGPPRLLPPQRDPSGRAGAALDSHDAAAVHGRGHHLLGRHPVHQPELGVPCGDGHRQATPSPRALHDR